MKLINKYQLGSAFPFALYSLRGMFDVLPTPTLLNALSTLETSQSKKDDGLKILDDSIIKEVMQNALPNESNHFFTMLELLEMSAPFNSQLNRSAIIALAKEAATIIHNNKQYEKDVEHMMKEGSQSDYAIDRFGQLYVSDKNGKIDTIDLKTYHKNRKKYVPLTYNDLALIRANDDRGLFQSDMLTSLRGSVSVKKISNKIQTLVKALGNDTVSETELLTAIEVMGHHLKLPTHAQLEGLLELNAALESLGPDALFEVLKKESSPNMEAAFKYIINSLGNDEKLALQAKAVIELDGSYAIDSMIAAALGSFTTTEQTYSELTNKTTNAKINAQSWMKSSESYYLGPVETFLDGTLNRTWVTITDSTYKNQVGLLAQGTVIAAMTDDKGHTYPQGPTSHRLLESGFIKYVDTTAKMYYGQKEITPELLNKIMYDGGKGLRVWLPSDGNGGIDFSTAGIFYKTLSDLELDPEYQLADMAGKALKANLIFLTKQIPIKMDLNGNFSATNGMVPYIVYYGYAKDDKLTKGNGMTHTVTKNEGREAKIDEMETIYKALGYDDPNGFFNYDAFVKAPIFIKESQFALMDAKSYSGHGPRTLWQTSEELAQKQLIINNPQAQILASGALLFEE